MSDEQLKQLPPTALLVYRALEDADRPLTKVEIAERTFRSHSSVEKSLHRLLDEDLADSRPKLGDGRIHVYFLQP